MAIYYVSPTGNNSNSGLSLGSAFQTIQRGIDAMTVAGDTTLVADGVYTIPNGTNSGIVGYVRGSNAAGNATNPMTIKSINKWGALVQLSTSPATPTFGNEGFHISRPYWIVDGFEIQGPGGLPDPLGGGNTGISFYISNTTIRNNHIHNISTGFCTDSHNGSDGIFIGDGSGHLIEGNTIHTIGRLYSGEGGCGIDRHNLDHGIYIGPYPGTSINNVTIRNNIIYDCFRGWPIQSWGSSSPATNMANINIYNNTFADHHPANNWNPGHIGLFAPVTNMNIKNNIFYNATTGGVDVTTLTQYGFSVSNVVIDYNLSTNATTTGTHAGVTIGGNNKVNQSTTIIFVNPLARDYNLKAGSPAIDAGVNVGLPFTGTAPDMGAIESGLAAPDTTPPAVPTGFLLGR